MWNDNVTDKDFLGFDVHVNLIKELIKDENMLPLTIGLFGDWGSGKSSIFEILRKDFEEEENTLCLYFNGWVFEGYDDAKAALLETIIKKFEDNEKFGDKVKGSVIKLLKSINWMRVIGFSMKKIAIPTAVAFMTGGISVIPQFLNSLKVATQNPIELANKIKECDEESFVKQFIKDSGGNDNFDLVRRFRDEFEELLVKSEINKLVIIIDDLDRCLPDRIIDNLEAIKLFLNVKNTAFIIGADPRIVRHAIEYRYAKISEKSGIENGNDRIVNDYLEKLIQIPYILPKLSESEVETYITLLFCESDLEKDDFNKVLTAFKAFREKDRYSIYNFSKIKESIEDKKAEKLEQNVSLIAKLSPLISESLYGNPRQIKRFLNTFMLRKKLAEVAHISDFKDDVLAKLMILEYAEPNLFDKLYSWQISNDGIAKEIANLESSCKGSEKIKMPEEFKDWNKPKVIKWITIEPSFSKLDLRDYFWIARDRLSSMQSGLLVPPMIKSLIIKLEPDMPMKVTRSIIKDEIAVLTDSDQNIFFNILKQKIISESKVKRLYDIFNCCLEEGVKCITFYTEALTSVGKSIPPAVIESLKRYNQDHPELTKFIENKNQKGKS
ncbi:ATPase [Spirochaetia bacterium]|nr:ATPase [Spirochaetia bacterium]